MLFLAESLVLTVQASSPKNMKLFGFIFFLWFGVCLSRKEPSDVTIVYNVTENASDTYTIIHLGTSALGLPVIVDGQLTKSEYEFFLEPDNQNLWEVYNWSVIVTEDFPFTYFNIVQQENSGPLLVHLAQLRIELCIHMSWELLCRQFIFCLTPDPRHLSFHPVFYCVVVHKDACSRVALYTCGKEYHDVNLYIDGFTYWCKKEDISKQRIMHGNNYMIWYINQTNGGVEFKRESANTSPVFFSWKYDSPVVMTFYKMFTDDGVQAKVMNQGPVLETSSSRTQLRSPVFTPKYKHMCLVVVFHTNNSLQHSVRVYAVDSLSNQIQLGIIGSGSKGGWQIERIITPWPENITSSPISVMIETSTDTDSRIKVARISSCNSEDGVDVITIPTFVPYSAITVLVLNESDSETNITHAVTEDDVCWHGSSKIDGNMCACLPGFTGSRCKQSCGRNTFGKDCKRKCSIHTSECRGLLLCTSEFGCYCAPGYKGDKCEEECESGTYGNNCTQTCGHCEGGTCDIYSGECFSCLPGYQLPFCKHKYASTRSAPLVSVTRRCEVTVKPVISNVTNSSTLDFYSIQYKNNFTSDLWVSHSIHPIPRTRDVQETVIKDLEHDIPYKVRTVLIDRDFNSYEGEDIPAAYVLPCIIPKRPDYHITTESSQTSLTVSWSYTLEYACWCHVEKFEVSWKNVWKWLTKFTNNTNITITDLSPSTTVSFKVRALTSNGFAPYSPTVLVSTKDRVSTVPVANLRVETVDCRTAKIRWDPPLSRYNVHLSYLVKYKCLRRVACQKNCEESAGELHVTNTSVTLAVLYPFSQYKVTVSPEGGPSRNLIFGTKMSEPVEIPELSSRPPVRTNTSITVYWNQPVVCSGLFTNYVYQFYKLGDMQLVKTGSTVNTSISFDNSQVSTDYKVLVYIQTSFSRDVNPSKYLEIIVSTFATVPEKVQNLTVYKQGRYLLGLRWASPNKTHGSVVSFTIKYGYRDDADYKTEIVKPNPCIVWPHLFCHTIEYLQADRVYKISVSARNSEVDADGTSVQVTGITKEKSPGAPENVNILKVMSNSVLIQWDHPWMANGIVRSFLINIEETQQFEEENCCQVHPIIETTVTNEQEHYSIEVVGLNSASTYVVSVSAKTVALGSAQSITVHTRPPSLSFAQLPNVTVNSCSDVLTWLPQKHNFTDNSDLYKTLIRGSLLLVLSTDTDLNSSGINDEKLDNELKNIITEDFYLAAEYTDIVATTHIELGTGENLDGKWGKINNRPLHRNNSYQLAAVQVAEYCGVYGIDIVWSSPFVVT